MAKILLDFVFPISVIESIPQASTAFLRQAVVVVKPKAGQEANVGKMFVCTSMAQVTARTANTEAQQCFNAGMTRVIVLLANDLNLVQPMFENRGTFFTLLISSDFADADIIPVEAELTKGDLTFVALQPGVPGNGISIEFLDTATAGNETVTVTGEKITVNMEATESTCAQLKAAIDGSALARALIAPVVIASGKETEKQAAFAEDNLEDGAGLSFGVYEGVLGFATTDVEFAKAQAKKKNTCVFFKTAPTGAKNLFYAFGKLLSSLASWRNQQYIEMPFSDDIQDLGMANLMFDERISFVLSDDEYANRLAFFVAGGKAIAAPYITKNLRIDLQSAALVWIAANQPDYTLKEASLLETRLQEDVVNSYIERGWIESGDIDITLLAQNFVATGDIEIPTPKALWRVFNQMTETN